MALGLAGWATPEAPAAALRSPLPSAPDAADVPGLRGFRAAEAGATQRTPQLTSVPQRKAVHAGRQPERKPHWTHAVRTVRDFEQQCPGLPRLPSRSVLLTVDDGPDPTWTPRYLRLFAAYGLTATFCMIGRQVVRYPHLVRAVHRAGHDIANHTFDHVETLPHAKPAVIRSQILRTQRAVERATGGAVVPRVYRAPGGAWGPAVYRELHRENLVPLAWDVDPSDWARPGTAHIVADMLTARAGDIILCHDGGGDRSETYAALKTVIPALRHRGLRFATLPI